MNTSTDGIDALKRREGLVYTMYRDSAGLPTIGVGHLLTRDELRSGKIYLSSDYLGLDWRNGLTAAQVDALLRQDVDAAEVAVTTGVHVSLAPSQFDALVSFVFNVGVGAFLRSTLRKLLNAGDYAAVPGQLRRWVYSAGEINPILVKRREDEIRQWQTA